MNENGQAVLTTKALAVIKRENMLQNGDNVLVALSGGADSMSLLVFLRHNRDELKLGTLTAAHINHGLRGEEAERDEKFVREQCEKYDIPLLIYKSDVASEAAKYGEGIEEAGRRVRYAYLAEQAVRLNACIATAHTLSDSIETVLFHMARGCGLRGLRGIPPIRYYTHAAGKIKIIRPLIDCTRTDVELFCKQNTISYIQDSTNTDTAYARNRIRHCILPEFQKVNTGFEETFSRMMRHVQMDDIYLSQLAKNALRDAEFTDGRDGYDSRLLYRLPSPLRVRALDMAIRKKTEYNCSDAQLKVIESLLLKNGSIMLNQKIQIRVSQGRFAVIIKDDDIQNGKIPQEILLTPGISCIFYGRIYMSRLLSLEEFEKEQKIHKNLLKNSLNYDKITGNLFLRARQPGDFYYPVGRGIKKTLKKLFGEAKLPAEQRDAVPLVCDEKGIILVAGFGCDERVRIDKSTHRILVLESVNTDLQEFGRHN